MSNKKVDPIAKVKLWKIKNESSESSESSKSAELPPIEMFRVGDQIKVGNIGDEIEEGNIDQHWPVQDDATITTDTTSRSSATSMCRVTNEQFNDLFNTPYDELDPIATEEVIGAKRLNKVPSNLSYEIFSTLSKDLFTMVHPRKFYHEEVTYCLLRILYPVVCYASKIRKLKKGQLFVRLGMPINTNERLKQLGIDNPGKAGVVLCCETSEGPRPLVIFEVKRKGLKSATKQASVYMHATGLPKILGACVTHKEVQMMRIREGSVEIGNEFRWLNPEIASPDGEKDGNETKWDESGKRFLSVLLTLINLEFPIHQATRTTNKRKAEESGPSDETKKKAKNQTKNKRKAEKKATKA